MKPELQRIAIAEACGWVGVPARHYWQANSYGERYWSSERPQEVDPKVVMSTLIARWLRQPNGEPVYIMTDGPTVNHHPTRSRHAVHEGFDKFEGSHLYSFRRNPWPDVKPSLEGFVKYLPDYLNDLNAMHEAEEFILAQGIQDHWLDTLVEVVVGKNVHWSDYHCFPLVNRATAAQRAETFLKTLNLWTDE